MSDAIDISQLEPGMTIRADYGPNGLPSEVYHVRGIVDERVVWRRWDRSRKLWIYTVEDQTFFDVYRSVLAIEA